MSNYQSISIGRLLLDVANYRIIKQENQKGARDAIIAEQGKKLAVLAKDIIENGTNPSDIPIVINADDEDHNFIVIEGNRRLTAIQLLQDPELAKGSPIHGAFVKLSKTSSDAIPQVIYCSVAPNLSVALMWADRKHANGLEGAGTEPWTTMAKARAKASQGVAVPELDVVNFVLTNPNLDAKVRNHLEGSRFNLSTLERLVTTDELKEAVGLKLSDGRLVAENNKSWVQAVLTDVVTIIATSKHNEKKWTEREIDTLTKRASFVAGVVAGHDGKKPSSGWSVSGSPSKVKSSAAMERKPAVKSTPSTDDQPNLIPKKFKLSLPAGKINDVFVELKTLNVTTYRHAVSVLFRVFIDLTLDEFIKKNNITLRTDNKGKVIDTMKSKIEHVMKFVQQTSMLTDKELLPIKKAVSDQGSVLAPETLNAYVHSKLMNPDPQTLKIAWHNIQFFIERLWSEK